MRRWLARGGGLMPRRSRRGEGADAVCEEATNESYRSTPADAQGLREAGWTEPQIAEAVYITLFAFFNRVANAFGLADPQYYQTENRTDPLAWAPEAGWAPSDRVLAVHSDATSNPMCHGRWGHEASPPCCRRRFDEEPWQTARAPLCGPVLHAPSHRSPCTPRVLGDGGMQHVVSAGHTGFSMVSDETGLRRAKGQKNNTGPLHSPPGRPWTR